MLTFICSDQPWNYNIGKICQVSSRVIRRVVRCWWHIYCCTEFDLFGADQSNGKRRLRRSITSTVKVTVALSRLFPLNWLGRRGGCGGKPSFPLLLWLYCQPKLIYTFLKVDSGGRKGTLFPIKKSSLRSRYIFDVTQFNFAAAMNTLWSVFYVKVRRLHHSGLTSCWVPSHDCIFVICAFFQSSGLGSLFPWYHDRL